MSTVRDLIKRSMRLIGASAAGETPSANEQADALTTLNGMLSSWSTESLLIFAKVREELTLIPSQSTYSIGLDVSADFNTARPQRIENASVILSGSELPIDLLNQDEWAMITVKNTQSSRPTGLYYVDTYPLGTINLWPVPSEANALVLYSWKPLDQFASANTTVSLPPGYEDAIVYNLAVRLAPEYGRQTPVEVGVLAVESKTLIQRMNTKPMYLGMDAGITQTNCGGFDFLTGGYRR